MKWHSAVVFLSLLALIVVPVIVFAAIDDEMGADDTHPVWSPDSSQIAFTSWRTGNADIWLVNVDGTGLRNLTESTEQNSNPSWSPDGQRIVFNTQLVDGNREIYIMNASGGGAVNLSNHPTADSRPTFSSTGEWILFESRRSGKAELYIMRPDGSDVRQVSDTDAPYYYWDWSPDGRFIVYMGEITPDRVGVHLYDVESNQITNLLENFWFNNPTCCIAQVDWSPDGGEIAFMLPNDGTLYRVDFATGVIRAVAYMGGSPRRLAWLPDGGHIVVALNNNPGAEPPGTVGTYRVDVISGAVELIPGTVAYPYFYPSPDSRLFLQIGYTAPTQLYVYSSDGTVIQDAAVPFTNIFGENWSPNSRYHAIALCNRPESDSDIYVLDIETGQIANVTQEDAFLVDEVVPSQCPVYG